MFLYCYLLIGTSIVSTTLAESASNQAISSQSYDRGDVPLSYKNDVIHSYTSPRPHPLNHSPHDYKEYDHQKTRLQQSYDHIQYAPLPLKSQTQEDKAEHYTEVSGYSHENLSQQGQEQKKYIEPHLIKTQEPTYVNTRYMPYVPGVSGHNVVLQALKHRLTQNGVSTNHQSLVVKNNEANVKTLQPQVSYQRPEGIQHVPQNTQASVTEIYTPRPIYSILAHQYIQNAKKYNIEVPSEENADRQPVYIKAPKVQLNVARSHNIALAPHKAPINVNSNIRKTSLPQELIFKKQILQTSNIRLYPAQKRNIFLNHRSA